MAADGNTDTKPEVQRAVAAGTDLTQGSEKAYEALKQEVDSAQAKFGANTPEFNRFGADVAKGLAQSGALEEMSEQWARHNIEQVATSDQRHIKPADLNPQFGTNALESAFLGSLGQNYADLQQRAGKTGWGNTRTEFGEKELNHVLDSRQAERDQAEQARMAQESAARQQAKFTDVTTKLLGNDGNPNDSLFAVLDGIKSGDGKQDGKISHSDLRRFEQDYAVRAARHDFGFTPENLKEVRTLDREWDEPLGRSLRGVDANGDPNGNINIEATSASLGVSPDHLFASYVRPGAPSRGSMSNVDGDAPGAVGSGAIPTGASGGFDANGNPIAANAPADRGVAQSPTPTDNGQVAQQPAPSDNTGAPVPPPGAGDARVAAASPGPAQGGFDANGNPIAAAPGGDGGAAQQQQQQPTDGRGAGPQQQQQPTDSQSAPPPIPGAGSGFDANGNPIAAGAGNPAATGDRGAQPAVQRNVGTDGRPVPTGQPTDNNAAQPPHPAGTGDAPAPTHHRHLKQATDDSGKPARLPDIDTAPALDLPVLKAGDDPNKVAQDFVKAALAHFQADAVYTVKAGQGWDRVARDTMHKTDGPDAAANEHNVEQYSDQIAKMNGVTGGRLDKSVVLQPGDQVRVRDDDWVKAQVENALKQFQAKLNDAAKTGPATAQGPTETKDLYSDSRNGGGDITPAPKVNTENIPQNAAPKDTTGTQPATDASKQQPVKAPEQSTLVPAAPPGDSQPVTPANPAANPTDGGPPPIPKVGADGKPVAPATPVADNSATNPANPNADAATADANDARKKAGASGAGAIDVTDINPAEVS